MHGGPIEGEYVEADHPGRPKGLIQTLGKKGRERGGGGGEAPISSDRPATPTPRRCHPVATKQQLPADSRGTWVSGTKGNGIFRYSDSAENRLGNLVGKEVRYENDHIAVGGFPPESYHGGGADAVTVEIPKVTGFNADNLAADAAMRKKLGDPNWQRPKGYVWNHAGGPESTTMELVNEGTHKAISHKGPAAVPRAIRRIGRAGGGGVSAMGALTAIRLHVIPYRRRVFLSRIMTSTAT